MYCNSSVWSLIRTINSITVVVQLAVVAFTEKGDKQKHRDTAAEVWKSSKQQNKFKKKKKKKKKDLHSASVCLITLAVQGKI